LENSENGEFFFREKAKRMAFIIPREPLPVVAWNGDAKLDAPVVYRATPGLNEGEVYASV
jgi:hypothetical protein